MGRKVNEILLALVANAIYSKKTILEAYLNRVYLGNGGLSLFKVLLKLPCISLERMSANWMRRNAL